MMRAHQMFCALALLATLGGVARAEPRTWRLATVAPDGTLWAREMKAFAREVETSTGGEVKVKWIWGGIAGDEDEVEKRIARGQLDGAASGGMMCQRAAPSTRVLRVPGLFADHHEASHIISRLLDITDAEYRKSGFVNLATPNIGPDIVFLKRPISTFEELRKLKLWRWELDETAIAVSRGAGLQVQPLPVYRAGPALEAGQVDGLIGIPGAALAFQWFTKARYFLDLHMGFLAACIVVTTRSFDRLPREHQQAIRSAGAKLQARSDLATSRQDEELLGGLFAGHGMQPLPLPKTLYDEFAAATRTARDHLSEQLVPKELLQRVLTHLADYRADHPAAAPGK